MNTRDSRIAELNEAIARHKSLALLLTSWSKSHQGIIRASTSCLQSLLVSLEQVERETAEAEAALAKLEAQPTEARE